MVRSEKTSSYDFYQFFLRVEDTDVIRFLKVLTQLSLEEIYNLEKLVVEEPHKRAAQHKLAEELTLIVHGKKELEKVKQASKVIFGAEINKLDDETIAKIFHSVPGFEVSFAKISEGWKLVDAFVESGSCASKSQARKLAASGGVYVNNTQIKDPDFILGKEHLASKSYIVFRTGKKNYRLISVK